MILHFCTTMAVGSVCGPQIFASRCGARGADNAADFYLANFSRCHYLFVLVFSRGGAMVSLRDSCSQIMVPMMLSKIQFNQ